MTDPLDGAIVAELIPDEDVADATPDTDLESSPKNDPVIEEGEPDASP